ncbi:MAG: class I SAM-dependent methyltransferase [Fimbriiglobus sp.]
MLPRILEPEVMDTQADAHDYDAMDHGEVNRRFVQDFRHFYGDGSTTILDVGTGTALIPIEFCRQRQGYVIIGIDAAQSMIDLAQENIARANHSDSIQALVMNARAMTFGDGPFECVVSNSIIHHISEPLAVLREMVRVTKPGGTLFVRDLARPEDLKTLQHLVATYAKDANAHQKQLFSDSLHAALTLGEIQEMVAELGFEKETVSMTSNRHWTWAARKR